MPDDDEGGKYYRLPRSGAGVAVQAPPSGARLTRFGAAASEELTPLQVYRRLEAVEFLQEKERRGRCSYQLWRFRWLLGAAVLLGAAAGVAFTVYGPETRPHAGTVLRVASIPVVALIFTYFHISLALQMMFYPLEFVGCFKPFCGWQGIVPMKAHVMAATAVDLMTEKLVRVEDVFARIDPERVAAILEPTLRGMLGSLIRETAAEEAPGVWEALPEAVRQEVVTKATEDAPAVIASMMEDVKGNIADVFDLKGMVVGALTRDKALLNEMFQTTGAKELQYIKTLGAKIGFLCGVAQAVAYLFYNAMWVLPVTGFVVGYLTNWLALQMIFRPIEPVTVCCGHVTLHGLFLRRQREVSAEYAGMVSARILSSRNIIDAILRGPESDCLFEIVSRHTRAAVDAFSGASLPAVVWAVGGEQYERTKARVCDRLLESVPEYADTEVRAQVETYAEQAMDLENLLFERMSALSSRDFEGLLHPIFAEDEWKLIVVGGVLGVVVGFGQFYALGG